jgi:DHA2 family methylenomycin A resistance protein-like MFS transporter
MPAMTAAVVGAAGPEHAGMVGGVLNAARQCGGALGVAVLGSLLGHGHSLSLHVPLLVATAGYLVAIALALGLIRRLGHLVPAAATIQGSRKGVWWHARRCSRQIRPRSAGTA